MARPRGGKRNSPDGNRGNSNGATASGGDKENRKRLKPQQQQQQRKEKERGVAASYPPKHQSKAVELFSRHFFLVR